ncbi:MAG: hypothetical protein INH41_07490 [Myxococcaceae bacterium]|jgi:hypothetical protein|nr:hypothetical protein [Myxococcaceae bacterium]
MLTFACTVCGAGQEGTEWAYLAMTGVVSLTPLAMIGGVAWWLYRASKRREAEDALRAQALEALSPAPRR